MGLGHITDVNLKNNQSDIRGITLLGKLYKVVEREFDSVYFLVGSINEAGDRKMIRLVDGIWSIDRVKHGPYDDVRIDDSQVKRWFVHLRKFPRRRFSPYLGDIVPQDGITPLDCLFGRDLYLNSHLRNTCFWVIAHLRDSNLSRYTAFPPSPCLRKSSERRLHYQAERTV